MKIISALLLVAVFLIREADGQVRMYSDFSLTTVWTQKKRFDHDSIGSVANTTIWGADSLRQKMNDWIPSGIFGVIFKKDAFDACIELSVGCNSYDLERETNTTIRYLLQRYNTIFEAAKWYAEWHASENITILTGRDYTPVNSAPTNRLMNPLIGYNNTGRIFTGSRPMFQGTFTTSDKKITAKAALIKIDTVAIRRRTGDASKTSVSEGIIPKIEASVEYIGKFFESAEIQTKIAGGFQTYNDFVYPLRNIVPPKDPYTTRINSFLAGGDASIKIWKVTLAPSLFAGRNPGAYGVKTGTPATWWKLPEHQYAANYFPVYDTLMDSTDARLYNSFVTEWAFSMNFELFKFLSLGAGYEDIIGDHQYPKIKEHWLNSQNHGYYGQCLLTICDKLRVAFEAGFTKYGKYRGYGQYSYCGLGIRASF